MPILHTIRTDLKLIVSVHIGAVPDDEFLQSYRTLYAEPDFEIAFDHLVDLRRAQSNTRSASALQTIALIVEQRHKGSEHSPKTAIIAKSDVSFGLSRMYQAFSNSVPGERKIFKAPEAALAWLGAPADVLDEFEVPPDEAST